MLSLFRSHRGKRDQKSRRTPASRKLVLESLEEHHARVYSYSESDTRECSALAARRRDTTPPIVSITAPQNNSTVFTPTPLPRR